MTWEPPIARLVTRVAELSGCSRADILGNSRAAIHARPRQAVFLAAHEMGLPYIHIGRHLGRDHSTVMHGVKVARHRVTVDKGYAEMVAALTAVAN